MHNAAPTAPASLPLIVDVKRLSDTDGPGLRDVVFFKGCPLRCSFCHNPESQAAGFELAFHRARCIQCGSCAPACHQGAIDLTGEPRVDRSLCQPCNSCASVCPTGALRVIGSQLSVDELVGRLVADTPYFRHSQGGVTLSGGECTQHLEFVGELARRLHQDHGLHVAIQTCGHFDWARFETSLLPFVDWIYFDLKLSCPATHRQVTGQDNTLILENFARLLACARKKVHPRIPLIPQLTDTRENLARLASLLVSAGATTVSLLPFNPLGLSMHEALGRRASALPSRHYTSTELALVHQEFQSLLRELMVP